MRLLIVEDDTELSSALVRGFEDEGFAVDRAPDGPEGLHQALSGEHDLVILDLMLPGIDGFRVLRELREEGNRVPVLFLTARGSVEDRIRGLQLGGDDYLPKPFSFEELLARVRALLRRANGVAESALRWGELVVDAAAHTATWKGAPIPLTPKEFGLLEALLLQQGKVLNRSRLGLHVYDWSNDLDSNVLDVHLANLRRKLREATGSPVVETVRGVGFRIPLCHR